MVHVQGAQLAYEGDLIEPAYIEFTKWFSTHDDPKGAQLGAVTYANGTVRFIIMQSGASRLVMSQTDQLFACALLRRARAPSRSI